MKHCSIVNTISHIPLQTDPILRGLKPGCTCAVFSGTNVLQTDPILRGLKLETLFLLVLHLVITNRPDFKGIETLANLDTEPANDITNRPDFKGIETYWML